MSETQSHTRTFKGISIPAEQHALVRHMLSVDDFREALRELKSTWDNLSLLGQLTGIGTDVGETREDFHRLTETLITSLIEESLNKVVDELGARAQVSIDIVVRNLFERTADIGFLATDANIIDFLSLQPDNESWPIAREALQQRFASYVSKYSVYSNVLLLNPQGDVVAVLDDTHTPLGFRSADPLIQDTLSSTASYVETFRAIDLLPQEKQCLVYSCAVRCARGEPLGVLCLIFKFNNEMTGIYQHLSQGGDNQHDWSVMTLVNEDDEVIASSSPWQVSVGANVGTVRDANWKIIAFGNTEYLTVTRQTNGYQGYMGPGWSGQVMVPLQYAFLDEASSNDAAQLSELTYLVKASGLFSEKFTNIPADAEHIQRQLNRSVWNGNLRRDSNRDSNLSGFNQSFAKILLWEIANTGAKTRDVFSRSIAKLNETALSRLLQQQQFMAALAIDIMDRNLYERANDARWWALTKRFREVLSDTSPSDKDLDGIQQILQYIHSLYTVYSNLVLFDRHGKILASTTQPDSVGTVLQDEWVQRCLQLKHEQLYVVSPFEPSSLYHGNHTYVYAAAIQHLNTQQTVGGIAISFDSTPQFEAMIRDSLPATDHTQQESWLGYFIDAQGMVIASNDPTQRPGSQLSMPSVLEALPSLQVGQSYSHFIEHDEVMYAAGLTRSKGYREFKAEQDAYQEPVFSLVLKQMGRKQTQTSNLHIESSHRNEQGFIQDGVEVATFMVSGQQMGVLAQEAVVAIEVPKMVSVPGAPAWICGLCVYEGRSTLIIDMRKLLGQQGNNRAGTTAKPANPETQQVIIIHNENRTGHYGLMVDDLVGIPTFSRDTLMSSVKIFDSGKSFIESLARSENGILAIISTQQIRQLVHGVEKTMAVS